MGTMDFHHIIRLLLNFLSFLVAGGLVLYSYVRWACRASRGSPSAVFFTSLQGKHLVITGGSSGIGYSIAKQALEEGAYVTLVARNCERLQAAKESLQREVLGLLSSKIILKAVDVSDSEATTAAIQEAYAWRPIDVLVCNAGVVFPGHFDEVSITQLDDAMKINVMGSVYPVHAALPLMKQRNLSNPCSIVFLSSIAGMNQCYGGNIYAATKYAQKGLAEVLRWELMPYNIRVHAVCPGFVDTPMSADAELPTRLGEIARAMNQYDKKKMDTSDHVAACTLAGVKKGTFLITTSSRGHWMAILARGPTPEGSIATNLWELSLAIPARLLSFKDRTLMTNVMMTMVTPSKQKTI
ncbi:unnamed protein product [Sphagnum jensenii]|uniref:Uncharacterized protein n=1 Tax=Sphagnum jensenii TaxID=128206 RepID=A0ABP1BM09_9BRYO